MLTKANAEISVYSKLLSSDQSDWILTGNFIDVKREFGFEKEVALEDSYSYYSKEEKKVCCEHEVYGKCKPVNIVV